jgi:uncharacterized protein YecA (UPF0149 family)
MGGPQYFHKHLRTAREAAEPTAAFESHIRNNGRLDDAARHLSHWAAFRPEQKPHRVSTMAPTPRMNEPPIRDPYRGVGRNDPCPCGSGKKYKKCCLGKAR